ncbi:MAG: hypothetical protein F6K50_42760 [Moorea sp. SIO3I7]|uniref:hypothetical protein n=1 Tax=Moorena sp. SIO3I8 TaxID=2607833 RepID=UPI0013C14D09|nr:hypothetical protein [Moorena sp. SIO3I8]NEO01868.1 hypothetical protein [Moorena sp. SIO3I7]NEO05621.1 hypothetical protein [Moorena sp. SIO3I8]
MKHIVAALTIVGITVAQGFTNQVLANESPVGTVDKAQGFGTILRFSESVFIAVSIGEKLYPGDLLFIARGAYVVIECHNNNKWTIPEGILVGVNNACGQPISRFSENPPEKGVFYSPGYGHDYGPTPRRRGSGAR